MSFSREWQPTPVFLAWIISWTEEAAWAIVHEMAKSHLSD